MNRHSLHINIPLPEISGENALELSEFLNELAGRIELSSHDSIERYHREADAFRAEQRYKMLFGKDAVPVQLELFDDLEPF